MRGECICGPHLSGPGKNDLEMWRFETKPVFGGEKAGNQGN